MKRTTSIITAIYVAVLIGFIGYGYRLQNHTPAPIIQATVEAPQIRISAKIPGRVDRIAVREGDSVQPGDVIFTLDSPELKAKRDQALALIAAKTAMKDRAIRGARNEELAMAKDQMLQARTSAELADKSLSRLTNLYNDGLIPEQQLDEAQAKADAAHFALEAAKQQYQMAENGTEDELISAAESDLKAAQGALAEVDAALAETEITSGRAGEVTSVLIHEGEISPAGFPVVTLVNLDDAYLRFHVSEDQLTRFNKGQRFRAYLPGLNAEADFTVDFVSALGDYANWQATRPGEYDLKTFEVHARPDAPLSNWRAGMSAIITLDDDAA